MRRTILNTADGSTTIHLPDWDESYHSKHGAIQEARHVFIDRGLLLFNGPVSLLEIGFGTGLNCFITYLEALRSEQVVDYVGVEAYPVPEEEVAALNYVNELRAQDHSAIFMTMHQSSWGTPVSLGNFTLTKRRQFFHEISDHAEFDLIYFDAFGYRVQPELWSADIFQKMHDALKPGGVLVTYAARSVIKRNMISAGFTVEKMAGPPGKREMFRARKSVS